VEAVYLISFEHPDQLALQANVIEAARGAGVRMIARLSASSADPDSPDPLIRNHGVRVQKGQGLPPFVPGQAIVRLCRRGFSVSSSCILFPGVASRWCA
jgi:hypothetical protein